MKIREDSFNAEESSANLTPLIDVVFLLLIFFMLATTFLDPEKEIDIELPIAEAGENQDTPNDEIIINVHRDGSISISGQTVAEQDLQRVLRQAAVRNPDTQVTIRGDRLVHHEDIVRVMGAAGSAGLTQLSVGTIDQQT